jgi:sodium-coupled monocarboxylate transporter 8/12
VTKGKLSLYFNYVGQIFLFVVVSLIGLVLYAFYVNCDPVVAGIVDNRDAVVPIFVMQEFAKVNFIRFKFI